MKNFFLLIFFAFAPLVAQAKLFKNAYVSFELPDRWECSMEGTEWICRSTINSSAKEAIIILTAKEVGPSDYLQKYESYLKTPKSIPGPKGAPTTSQVKHVKTRKIGGHDWVDSLHLGSEIPSYYTRYLATVKSKLAILVTFSGHSRYYSKYSSDFFKAIESLKVIADPSLFQAKTLAPDQGTGEMIGSNSANVQVSDEDGESEDFPDEPTEASGTKEKIFAFGIIVAAIGIYLVLKRSQRG